LKKKENINYDISLKSRPVFSFNSATPHLNLANT